MSLPTLDLGCTDRIIEECKKAGLNRQQAAYVLATAYHETAHTMMPVEEGCYLSPAKAASFRKRLRYYPYHGRGFPQLTWRYNYEKYSARCSAHFGRKIDLVGDPDLAMDLEIAIFILIDGMVTGAFTGKGLKHYTRKDGTVDFINARRIINGTDRAEAIALIARHYLAMLDDY